MRIAKESIDRFFDYDLHIETRTIYLGDPSEDGVDHLMSGHLIKAVHLFHTTSDAPIKIILNSFGGCVFNGLAIYDAIRHSPCHVTIEVLGSAMSMGAVILQAADDRAIHEHATLMLHDGYDTRINDIPKTFENWAAFGKKSRQDMYRILADRTHKTTRYWEKKCQSDYILTAKEALAEGLVDRIIGETT